MTHAIDCPTRYGCCPNDEYGCAIHIEPPCNCSPAVADADTEPDSVHTGSGCSRKDAQQ